MFGFESLEAVVGRDVIDLVAPRDKERLAGYVRAKAEGRVHEAPTHYFATLLRANGEEFPAEIFVTETVYGGRVAWQVMAMDITERVRAEEELRRYRQGLENLVEQRTAELAEVNGPWKASPRPSSRTTPRS